MNTRKWLSVNQDDFSASEEGLIDGVRVSVFMSPYDIPQAISGECDDKKNRCSIQFHYIGSEEPVTRHERDGFVITTGKRTDRIQSIEFGTDKVMEHGCVELKLAIALDHFQDLLDQPNRAEVNHRIAKQLLSNEAPKLFADLVE